MKDLSLRSLLTLGVVTGDTTPTPPTGERPILWSTSENRLLHWNGTFWLPLYYAVEEVTASEALSAGNIVSLWNDAGTAKVRKADNTAGYAAHGFVMKAYSSGNTVHVCTLGENLAIAGMTPGPIYLGISGGVTSTAPSTVGQIVQDLGFALSATKLLFTRGIPITITAP